MVLALSTLDLTTEKKQADLIKKLLGEKVEVNDIMSLGKKPLAYEIKKQTEATYLVAHLTGTIKSGDLDTKMKLSSDVLRVLLINQE